MKPKIWFPCLCLLVMESFALAESFDAKDLVELAVQKNPELKAVRLEAEGRSNFASQEARWDNPNLDLGAERKDQPVGRTHFSKIGLSQPIMRPSRRSAKISIAKASTELARIEQEETEVHLRNDVLNLIFEYRAATEKAEHAKERLQRFRTVNTYLHSRVFASPQKQAEASIVRSKLLVLGKEFRELEAARKISWNRLNLYLGLKSEPTIKSEWFLSGKEFPFEKLLERARVSSPIIRAQKAKVFQSENELKLAQTNYFPGLTLNATYADGSGADPEKVYGLGISLPLPIWNFSGSETQGHRSQNEAERIRLAWVEEQVSEQLKSALEAYSAAKASLDELKISEVARLEKEMHSIDQNFKKGQVDLLVYIESDAEHFSSLNAIYDSQVQFASARAAVFKIVGQSPSTVE